MVLFGDSWTIESVFECGRWHQGVQQSGDSWTRDSVFECARWYLGVQQSGGSCALILISFWLDLAHREDGRFLVCVSQAGMRLLIR